MYLKVFDSISFYGIINYCDFGWIILYEKSKNTLDVIFSKER